MQTENSNGQYGGSSFAPITYDTQDIQPDAFPGEYVGEIVSATAGPTKESGKPMLTLEWKLLATDSDDENAQSSVGSTLKDWIVIAGDRTGNTGKVKLRSLRETLELDADILPVTLTGYGDFKPLCAALKGRQMTVWVTNRTDGDGNVRTNVQYAPPRASGMAPMALAEEEVEEEAPAPKAKKPAAAAKAPAKKPAARR
jgi:hypothetical protein